MASRSTGGRAKFEDLDWNTKASSVSYSDSKLLYVQAVRSQLRIQRSHASSGVSGFGSSC
jgi:hypothetical protein